MRAHLPPLADSLIAVATVVVLVVMAWQVGGLIDRQRAVIDRQEQQIETVRGAQECIIRLLLVEPGQREGLTVDRILGSCPDALPPRGGGG